MVNGCSAKGIPMSPRPVSWAAHIDAMQFCDHIPQCNTLPVLWQQPFYLFGRKGYGTRHHVKRAEESGKEILADAELLRLALPAVSLHFPRYSMLWTGWNGCLITGNSLEPAFYLRTARIALFMGSLEPVSDWPEKLANKFRNDFGNSL